jgi:hypothetical protein
MSQCLENINRRIAVEEPRIVSLICLAQIHLQLALDGIPMQ